MLKRLINLIIKEFISIWRDPQSRFIVIVPPIIQLLIFSKAATMEVKNIDLAFLDRNQTEISRSLIKNFENSIWFRKVFSVQKEKEIGSLIESQKIQMGLLIDSEFGKNFTKGKPTNVLIIVDGRQTNVASIASSYATEIISSFEQTHKPQSYKSQPRISVEVRNWFNPNLTFIWYTVISLVAIIASVEALVLTSMSVARERELGTFDQLIVSPLSSFEIMAGKTIPPLIFSLITTAAMGFIAIFVFKIPFTGSIFLFYLSSFVFLVSILGIGLFISSICKTQQQAILGAFAFQMPAILMSGYVSPIEDMPKVLQYITFFDPIRFYLVILKGVFLKAMPADIVLNNILPLLLIGIMTLSLASWMFKRNLE